MSPIRWDDLVAAATTARGPAMVDECDSVLRQSGLTLVDVLLTDHQRRSIRSLRTGLVHDDPELTAVAIGGQPLQRGPVHFLPMRCTGRRVGAIGIGEVVDAPGEPVPAAEREAIARLISLALEAAGEGDDDVSAARRRREMSLPAELQWSLLPAPEHTDERVRISGALEPAYDTGGDVFDYGCAGDLVHLCVMDAMGHGMGAALVGALATSAWRQARRREEDLASRTRSIHDALLAEFGHRTFVAAVLAELDVASGSFRWVNAGHLPPMLWTGGELEVLETPPVLPLGMELGGGFGDVAVHHRVLDRGECILLHTDGMIDNLDPDGRSVGPERFRQLLRSRLDGVDHPIEARDAVDDLMGIASSPLRDDATMLIVERC